MNDVMNSLIPTDIRRACLLVSNLDHSLQIYHDVLGLQFWYDEKLPITGNGLPAGEPNSLARLVILHGNHELLGMLGIMEFLQPPLPPRSEIPRTLGIGDTVFVLNHADVESVHEQLMQIEGVHIYSAPHVAEYPKPDGTVYRRLGISFFDMDGYFFEVNQLLN